MKKNVIYVDFIYKHKKISHFKYRVLFLFSSILKKLTLSAFTTPKTYSINKKKKSV